MIKYCTIKSNRLLLHHDSNAATLKTNKMKYSAKQIKAIRKAELLLLQANKLLIESIGHLEYDIIVAQKLSRVRAAAETSFLLDE